MASQNDFEAEMRRVRDAAVAKKSRDIYINLINRFLNWLLENAPDCLTDEYRMYLEGGQSVIEYLSNASNYHFPLNVNNSRSIERSFLRYIIQMRKSDGSFPAFVTLTSHRSALNHLYRIFGEQKDSVFENELTQHFRGLKRENALRIAEGNVPIKVGKDPMSYSFPIFRISITNP
jgi:hypothetical protein